MLGLDEYFDGTTKGGDDLVEAAKEGSIGGRLNGVVQPLVGVDLIQKPGGWLLTLRTYVTCRLAGSRSLTNKIRS